MKDEVERIMFLSVGAGGAILLGALLIPLRGFTTASNLTFPFMALTIAIAELGGARAAVATALTSALSLDFFLTRPYLRLTIEGKHDVIAFVGLAACGLVAAGFSSYRERRMATLFTARRHLDLIQGGLRQLYRPEAIQPSLERVLHGALEELPISALQVRDAQGHVVASSGGKQELPAPAQILDADSLLPARPVTQQGAIPTYGAVPLSSDGARVALGGAGGRAGWLEIWGDGQPASAEARGALADVGRLAGLLLARIPAGGSSQPMR